MLSEIEDDTPRHGTRTPIKYRFDKENYERLKGHRTRMRELYAAEDRRREQVRIERENDKRKRRGKPN